MTRSIQLDNNLQPENSIPVTPVPLRRQRSNSGDEGKKPARVRDGSLDGGWGWVVLFGSFYITTFLINVTQCFGILFSQKMKTLSASSTNVSIIFSMHNVMWNFGILLTSSLVSKFGYRSVTFWGCSVASISFMLLAFSSSVTYVFIMYSFILAISGGIGTTVCFLLVPQYFHRRRGLAMAVLMTGIAFGGIISPLLIRALQYEYGFFGGFLIHGAVISNCCVAAALYRPPPIIDTNANRNTLLIKNIIFQKISGEETSANPVIRVVIEIAHQTSKWIIRKIIVLKQLRVILTGFSLSTIMVGFFNFLVLVPFSVESDAHSPMFSAWCIATLSVTNTGVRLLMAIVADRSWFPKRAFFILGAFLSAISTLAFVFVSSSERLMTVVMLSGGVGIGLYMSLFHVNLIDALGMELYPDAVGVNSLIMAVTFAAAGPLFGLLHDLSGFYSWSVCACAVLQLCSALLLLPLPLAVARDKIMFLKHQENDPKE